MAEINNLEDIKTNFEQITNLINSMRAQGVLNYSGIDKVLTAINTKLENLDTTENTDLIKLLIGEIKTNIEERHGYVAAKFSDIENSINTLLKNNATQIKSEEIKQLFDVIATNLSVFSKEVVSQKDALTEITLRLEALRVDDTDKKDIIKNIATLKFDLAKLNNGFESIILNINNNFSELSQSFAKLAESNQDKLLLPAVQDIHATSNSILSAIEILDKKNSDLNSNLERFITIGDFNEAKDLLHTIAQKSDDLASVIANTADRESLNNLNSSVATTINAISELKNYIANNLDGSNQGIINHLELLENSLKSSIERFDMNQIKNELFTVINQIGNETNLICTDLIETNTDLKHILSEVNFIDLNKNISDLYDKLNNSATQSLENIQNFEKEYKNSQINQTNTILNHLTSGLNNIEIFLSTLKNDVQTSSIEGKSDIVASVDALSVQLQNLILNAKDENISSLDTFRSSIYELKNEIYNNKEALNSIISSFSDSFINNLNEITTFTENLRNDLVSVFESNSSQMENKISELLTGIRELGDKINNVDFEASLTGVNSKISDITQELQSVLSEIKQQLVSDSNANILSSLEEYYVKLGNLTDNFKNIYLSDSEGIKTSVSKVYDAIQDINTQLPVLIEKAHVDNSNDFISINTKLQETNTNISNLITRIDNNDFQNVAIDRIDAINSDIKFVINSLSTNLDDYNHFINQKISELDSDIKTISGSIFENIGSNQAEINNRLNSIIEVIDSIKNTDKSSMNEECIQRITSTIENISNEVKSIIENQVSNNNNDDVWIEKFDDVANNIFTLRHLFSSSINGANIDITDKINSAKDDINGNIQAVKEELISNNTSLNEKFENVSGDIKSVTDKLANYFINNDSDIVSKIDEVTSKIYQNNQSISEKYNDINNYLTEISQSVNNENDNITNSFENLNNAFTANSGLVSNKIEGIEYSIKSAVENIINHLMSESSAESENIENKFNNIDLLIKNAVTEIIDKVSQNVEDKSAQVELIENSLNTLREYLSVALSNNEGKLGVLSDSFNSIKSELLDNAGMNAFNIQETVKSTSDNIRELVENRFNGITELLNNQHSANIADTINTVTTQSAQDINANINETKITVLDKLTDKIASNTEELIQVLEEKGINNCSNIITELKNSSQTLFNNIFGIKENIAENSHITNGLIEEKSTKLIDILNSIHAEISTNFEESKPDVDLIITTIATLRDSISELISADNSGLLSNISNNLSDTKYEVIENITTSTSSLKEVLGSSISDLRADMNTTMSNTAQDIHSNIDNSKIDILNKVTEKIDLGVSQLSEKIFNVQDSERDKLISSLTSYSEEMKILIETLQSTINCTSLDLSKETDATVQRISEALSTVQEGLKNQSSINLSEIKSEFNVISTSISTLFEKLDATSQKIDEKLYEKLENIKSYESNISNSITQVILNLDELHSTQKDIINEKCQDIIDLISKVEEKNSETSESIHANINYKFEDLKNIINEINNTNTKSNSSNLGNIFVGIQDITNKLNELANSSVNNENIQHLKDDLESVKNIIEQIKSNSYENLDNTTNTKALLSTTVDNLTKISLTMAENRETLSETISEQVDKILLECHSLTDKINLGNADIQKLLDGIKASLNAINDNALSQDDIEQVYINLNTVQDQITEKLQQLKSDFSDVKSELQSFDVTEKLNSFEALVSDVVNHLEEYNEKQLNELHSRIKDTSDELQEVVTNNRDTVKVELTTKLNDIYSALADKINSIDVNNRLTELTDILNSIKTTIIETIDAIDVNGKIDSLTDTVNKLSSEQENISERIKSLDVSDKIENLQLNFGNIETLIDDAKKSVENIIINGIQDRTDNYSNISSRIDSIKSTLENSQLDQNIKESLSNTASDIEYSISTHSEKISETVDNRTSVMYDKLDKISDEIHTTYNSLNGYKISNEQHISSIVENLSKKINALQTELAVSSDDRLQTITNSLKSLEDSIKLLDENIDEDTTHQLTIIKEELSGLLDTLFVSNDQLINSVDKNFVDFNKKVDSLLNKFESYIEKLDDTVKNQIINEVINIKEECCKLQGLYDKGNNILEKFDELKADLKLEYGSIISAIEDNSAKDIVELSINKLDTIEKSLDKISDLNDSVNNNRSFINTAFSEIEEKIQSLDTNIDSLTQQAWLDEFKNIQNILKEQADLINNFSVSEDLEKLPNIEEIQNVVDKNINKLTELFNNKTKVIDNKLELLASNEFFTQELTKIKNELLTQNLTLLDSISFEIEEEEIIDAIQEKTNSLKKDIINELTNTKEDILATLPNKNDVLSEFDNVNQKLDDISNNYTLERGIENLSTKLDDIISEEINKVQDQLESVANNDDLQKEFKEVKKHLLTIQSGEAKAEYIYSLQDVETDIAKLRIAMKELQDTTPDKEINDITNKVSDISNVLDSIKNQLTQAELDELSTLINKMTEDIISISSRTNKLIITSENSANMLKDNIESFRLVVNDLDERTKDLTDNTDFSGLKQSVSIIQKSVQENTSYNNVVNQSLLTIAEWVDSASDSLTALENKVEKLDDIEEVKNLIRNIEKPAQFDYSVFETIEERFNHQQDKIDSLEEKINHLTELIEANDNSQLTKKIAGVDRQLAKLNKSIERLTSYVDEE